MDIKNEKTWKIHITLADGALVLFVKNRIAIPKARLTAKKIY